MSRPHPTCSVFSNSLVVELMKHRSSCESFLERFPFNPIIGIITLVAANLPLLNPRLPELSYLQKFRKIHNNPIENATPL